jgi:hypothetical protein
MRLLSGLLCLLFTSLVAAADKPGVTMRTSGSCSPAVADVKGNVTITCNGVSAEALKKLEKVPALLEQLIRNSDRAALIAKLDELIGYAEPAPTSFFVIYGFRTTADGISVNRTTFPYSDVKKSATYSAFRELLTHIPNPYALTDKVVIFRIRDEQVLDSGNAIDATSLGNLAVLIVPIELLQHYGNDHHMTFSILKSQLAQLFPEEIK